MMWFRNEVELCVKKRIKGCTNHALDQTCVRNHIKGYVQTDVVQVMYEKSYKQPHCTAIPSFMFEKSYKSYCKKSIFRSAFITFCNDGLGRGLVV